MVLYIGAILETPYDRIKFSHASILSVEEK